MRPSSGPPDHAPLRATRLSRCCSVALVGALGLAPVALEARSQEGLVEPVPNTRWGLLEPRDVLLDSTWFVFLVAPSCSRRPPYNLIPRWVRSMDVAGGRLFAATGNHIMAWSLDNPASPTVLFDECRPRRLSFSASDTDWYYERVVAAGDGSAYAAGTRGNGFIVANTSSPGAPTYQDGSYNVEAMTIVENAAGKEYVAVRVAGKPGLALYDFDKARSANCHDYNFDTSNNNCSQSKTPLAAFLSSPRATLAMVGAGKYLVFRYFSSIQVWDFSDPLAPVQVASQSTGNGFGVDAWLDGGQLHVAYGNSQTVSVLRYPSGMSCSGLCEGSLVATLSTPGGPSGGGTTSVDAIDHSEDDGRHYLFVSSGGNSGGGPQREYLFDIDDPTDPDELTPPPTSSEPLHDVEQTAGTGGYWGWYYTDNGGWEHVDPQGGLVANGHLYRYATALVDVHALVGHVPPIAGFTRDPAGDAYVGADIQFLDTSSRNPDSWLWTFGDGTTSTLQNPIKSYAGSPRTVTVTLEACNSENGLCDEASADVVLLDPAPTLAGVGVSPTTATPCQSIELTARDPTGRPSLVYDWDILDDGAKIADPPGGGTLVYTLPGTVTGPISAHLTLTSTNDPGQAMATSPGVTITALDPLGSTPVASYDEPTEPGPIQFHVTGDAGATEWLWTWGDGSSTTYTLASEGRNPTHEYASAGDYDVTVAISNCIETTPVQSATETVSVPNFTPLVIGSFTVQQSTGVNCVLTLIPCQVDSGAVVSFTLVASGEPDFYDFDWDGDGGFEDAGHTSLPTCPSPPPHESANVCHTYPANSTGTVTPRVRVRRGTESQIADADKELQFVVQAAASVSGPTSRAQGQSGTFSASVSDCSPTPSGWSWSASDLGDLGEAGSTMPIAWLTSGSKTVTATAQGGGCDGVQDSLVVNVFDPTISIAGPATLLLEQAGGFSAAPVECDEPSDWSWSASDAGQVSANGSAAGVTWSSAGPKTVTATAIGGLCDGWSATFAVHVFDTDCAMELQNESPTDVVLITTGCLVYLGPSYQIQPSADVDVQGAAIVIRPPFSVAPGAKLALSTSPP